MPNAVKREWSIIFGLYYKFCQVPTNKIKNVWEINEGFKRHDSREVQDEGGGTGVIGHDIFFVNYYESNYYWIGHYDQCRGKQSLRGSYGIP